MKKNLLVFVAILLFSTALIHTAAFASRDSRERSGHISAMGATDVDTIFAASDLSVADDWPMFQHDSSHSGFTASRAPLTNNTIWEYVTGGWVISTPVVVADRVYFGSNDNNLYCANASTGNLLWSFPTGGYVCSSPAVYDSRAYFPSLDNNLYCVNATTGATIWTYTTGGGIEGSAPAVWNGMVFVGSRDNNIHCVNATTGSGIWSYPTGDDVIDCPAVFDGRVYVGSKDNRLYCLNASTGQYVWDYLTGSYVLTSSPSISAGKVYVGSFDAKVYCLDAYTGAHIWDYVTGARITSTPAISYGRVYIGSDDDAVYCLNSSTGELLWSYTTGLDIGLSSAAISNGRVYIGSCDDILYCFDAYSGEIVWRYHMGDNVHYISISDGRLFVSNINGKVYAFEDVKISGRVIDEPTKDPVAGIELGLYDSVGELLTTTTTDADGSYFFVDLEPDEEYTVTMVVPPGAASNDAISKTTIPGDYVEFTIFWLQLEIELVGEFDYLLDEPIRIRISALLTCRETCELMAGADVSIFIYGPTGTDPLVQEEMNEKLDGIYVYTSPRTIEQYGLQKGIYVVYANASYTGGPVFHDLLEFHIDPPGKAPVPIYLIALSTGFACVSSFSAGWMLRKRFRISE